MIDLELNSFSKLIVPLFVLLVTIILLLRVEKSRSDRKDSSDDGVVAGCPNLDCVRCRLYAQVHASAQRRLPWILKSMSDDISTAELSRVKEGVCRGRRHYSGAVITGSHEISPAPGQHPTVLLIPQLSAVPVVTKSHEQTCRALEDHSDIILKEYLACRNSKVIQWKENDLPVNQEEGKKSSWRVLHLLNQGFWQDMATEMCPGTTRLLKSLDILQGCMFGNAFFSVITQGTVIEPHTGPSNARHRLQLPLQIPFEDDCGSLRVMDHELTWRQAFCFDDSFVHSATYRGKSLRVVFVVDLWHPDLSALERKVITQLYAATQLDQTKASGI